MKKIPRLQSHSRNMYLKKTEKMVMKKVSLSKKMKKKTKSIMEYFDLSIL